MNIKKWALGGRVGSCVAGVVYLHAAIWLHSIECFLTALVWLSIAGMLFFLS